MTEHHKPHMVRPNAPKSHNPADVSPEVPLDRVTIALRHCYGIKSLSHEFDFSKSRAFAIYAPNGVMKSSLARTFQDAADGTPSQDRIFKLRESDRRILDENGQDLDGAAILVVKPYDETLGVTEQTSTLLLEPSLKKEYDEHLRATEQAKQALLQAVRIESRSKQDMEAEISNAFTTSRTRVDAALVRIQTELEDLPAPVFAAVEYDRIFNEKVMTELHTKNLKDSISDYAVRYNELLDSSTYFKRGTFDYYNAAQVAASLANNGFFAAKHTLRLNAAAGNKEISTKEDLEKVVADEKQAILFDRALLKKFNDVAKQLNRNADLRAFSQYVQEQKDLLARLTEPEELREEVLKSYIKLHQNLYNDWLAKHNAARQRPKELEEIAAQQRTQWEKVIEIFNDRFFVPFRLEARNKTEVLLGQTSVIDVAFTYIDGTEKTDIEASLLLQSLSMGERKALYVLNVIFQIETRIKNDQPTLVVVDDIADSFDNQNKYAIIQYLKDISEGGGLFRLLIMTHNFDFFRTLESRFVPYINCLMASRNDDGVALTRASGIRNVFARDWKKRFFIDNKKKLALIPFLRNIVEMTSGEDDDHFQTLTAMLHWKNASDKITVGQLDQIYNDLCKTTGGSAEPSELIHELIERQAEDCLAANIGTNLENKIVLAMGIRMRAEKFMIKRIDNPDFLGNIASNQTSALIDRFRVSFPEEEANIQTLDRVSLMTPENIHVNSFMYEPLIDMSDDHLKRLYRRVGELA